MRIEGEWLLFEDGVLRPIIRGEVLSGSESWQAVEFLLDTGADKTVLSAAILQRLSLPSIESEVGISGLGGATHCVGVETILHLSCETGTPVVFKGRFTAVTDPIALDISVLGRDIPDLFAVIVDRARNVVCLLSQRHTYAIIHE